ncbi:MAG: hypothetical protein H6847_04680 [Hyphomonas sp.]|nr:hypothetical protein [Hyphomonas sp.]MCB9970780.1 hypothetical protein [Hyphomonas sp.]
MTLAKLRLVETGRLLDEPLSAFSLESVGNHFRKVIEAVAYAAMIAGEMEFGQIPRQIQNHWNAADILKFLDRKNLLRLPKRTLIEDDPSGEGHKYTVFDGTTELLPWLLEVYGQVHFFAHEANPYAQWQYYAGLTEDFLVEQQSIAVDLRRHFVDWLWQHVIQLEDKWYVVSLGAYDQSSAIVFGIPLPKQVDQKG